MTTRQEEFDKSVLGIIAQGKPSGTVRLDGSGTPYYACLYRSGEGGKCAAGHLIPDEIYKPEIEGLRASAAFAKLKLADNQWSLYGGWIDGLQSAHDDAAITAHVHSEVSFWQVWKRNLTEFLATYNESITVEHVDGAVLAKIPT